MNYKTLLFTLVLMFLLYPLNYLYSQEILNTSRFESTISDGDTVNKEKNKSSINLSKEERPAKRAYTQRAVVRSNIGNIWTFGDHAGLDFNYDPPVNYNSSAMFADEGCASICDEDGAILFYTNGIKVWNKNHAIMSNGEGLLGDQTSTQSGIIVPFPGDENKYYVFTVDDSMRPDGLNYSIVDLTLAGGLGEVTEKNINLIAPTDEKVASVQHENGEDYWVITHLAETNTFHAYLVSEEGVNHTPVVSNVPTNYEESYGGYLKFSPSGRKLAAVIGPPYNEFLFLYDFNQETGVLSNEIKLDFPEVVLPNMPYGVEFSPSERFLYFAVSKMGAYQIDITLDGATAIQNSKITITNDPYYDYAALQLGPDNKIYIALFDKYQLGVINNPDEEGLLCDYDESGVVLNNKCKLGLPTLISSIFKNLVVIIENTCVGSETLFTIEDTEGIESVVWDFGDPLSGVNNTSNLLNPTHIYSTAGSYNVSLTAYYEGTSQEFYFTVDILDSPIISAGDDQNIMINTNTSLNGQLTGDIALYNISWSPATLLNNANILDPTTINLTTTTTFTLTAENIESGCTSTDEVTIAINNPMSLSLSVSDDDICEGESITITSELSGGEEPYTYSWTSIPVGFTSSNANITVSPSDDIIYVLEVGDGVNPNVSDQISISVTDLVSIDPIADKDWCGDDPYQISGVNVFDYSSLNWTHTGTGSLNDDSSINPIYTPSGNDLLTGHVTFTLEAFPNSPCSDSDFESFDLNLSGQPSLDCGSDMDVCGEENILLDAVTASNYQSLQWSTSGSGSFNDEAILNPLYTFSDEDILAGTVTLELNLNNSICGDIVDQVSINIIAIPIVNAGADKAICETGTVILDNANVEHHSSVLWTSMGDGSFADENSISTSYTPGPNDIANEGVKVILNAYTDTSCPGTYSDTLDISIVRLIELSTHGDTSFCGPVAHGLTSFEGINYDDISWEVSGVGLVEANDLDPIHPIYTPGIDDVTTEITITATASNSQCPSVSASVNAPIYVIPLIYPESDTTICENQQYAMSEVDILFYYTMEWSSYGDGSFSSVFDMNPTYIPGINDIANGEVVLRLQADIDTPCEGPFFEERTLSIRKSPQVDAGEEEHWCEALEYPLLGVSVSEADHFIWTTSGTGSFDNDTILNPNYTPSEDDLNTGSVNLILTATNDVCDPVSDVKVVHLYRTPNLEAGSDISTCVGSGVHINEATAENQTGILWLTSGTGTFDDETLLNPTYYPSLDDVANGGVILTMEALSVASCNGPFTDQIQITLIENAIIDAGDDKLVCNTIPHLIDGATAINFQSMFWASSGTGTFSAGNTISPTYTPSDADMEAGFVVLTLTVSNPPCADQVDQMTLQIAHPPVVDAGEDLIMCAQEPFVIGGASAEYYTSLQWTSSGTGSVVNATTLAPQYIPSEADIAAGTVTLTLEAFTDNPCDGTFTDQMLLNIVPQPVANAGANETICEGDTLFIADADVINYQELYWNGTGTGSFINSTTLTPAYIPSSDDVENSPISLTLNAINEPCSVISDSRVLSITPLAHAYAGPDTVILPGEDYHNIVAEVENYSYFLWTTDGSGSFDNPTFANPIYNPSPMDTLRRWVRLTLTAQAMGGCGTAVDEMILVFSRNPYVDFFYPAAAWENTPAQFSTDTIVTDVDKVIEYHWDFGDGTFSDLMNPIHTYTNNGQYDVTLTITDTLFNTYSATHPVVVNRLPFAFFSYEQPTCSGTAVSFHDESNAPDDYIHRWHWDFGDGTDTLITFPANPDIEHVYPMDMTYDVTLTVETSLGGISSYTQPITIQPAPIAMFEYADTCQNMAATFTSNTVVNGGGNIVEYFWNFGDPESGVNNYAEGESAYHIYSAPGDYTVQHVAVNAQGCSDTVSQTITILGQPAVDFTFESNCQDQNVTFAIDPDVTNIADLALWHWDFGDGSESWEQNPVHIYAAAGVYTVTLYIENTAGCSNSVSQVITISDAPSALFDYSAPTCFGDPVDFVYISNPGAEYIVTWNWDWGNGETSTVNFPDDPNMSITYAEAGTYQVTLEVINASGCTATYSTDVVVNPTPVANLSFEQACQGNEVAFTSLSQGNGAGTITHYEWNFGDPTSGIDNTSDLVNPTHIYENPGTYGVSLTVTAINGCSDTRDTTITVNPAPEVDFAFEAACLGDATVFNSLDYVDVASIGEWHWDFGDGTTSNNPDPEHVYVIAGSYEVVLTVTDINGCDASAVKTVDIMNAPVAAFIFSGDACEGGVISFDDQSTADEVISQWVWDFGDGTTETVDYPNNPDIEHTFVQDGTFNVTLSIITETACESTYTQEVIISTAPEALIEYTPACLNAPFSFEGDALLNGGTEIWQWAWDFGDPLSGVANTSELQNANHTYTTAGTYTVSLVVTNMDGCTDTAFVDVSVGALPEIAMHISSPTCLGDTVSVDPDPDVVDMGAVDFIYWDMGDGNEYTADSVDHIYEFAGIYEITMTLTDTSGCVVSTLSEVEVTEKPIVQFDASAACEGNDTQFTDYSYVPNGEPIIQWAWDFDIDGAPGTATSELQNPTYNYPEAGDYTVRLVVTSASGCMDSIDMMISVLEGPNAGFTFEEFNCEAGKVIFTDTSEMTNNIPIVAWEWTFQDGYYSDEQHPYHIFDNTDETYDVILKVTDINGCEDSDTVAVYVPKALEVDFEYTPTCVGDVTYFNDTLIAPVGDTLIQWQWEFGDAASGANNFSTNQSPSHTYPEPGNYVVTLTATDKYYCTYTISKSIEIFPLPTAQFSYDQPQCSEELYFTDLSVGVVSQIQQWEWNWGDGSPNDIVTTAQTEPLAHTYLVDGDYDVSLTVTDENNCVHSFMMTVTKNPCVQALFAMSQDTICARNEVTIFDQSIPVGEVDNWTYDMGDGTTYTFDQTNYTGTFDHIYTIEGRYTISLNVDGVVNGTLYMDSEMHEIEVLSTPVPAFVAENVCFGLETQFIDQSTDAAVELISWNWDLGDEVHTSTQQDTSIIYAEYNTYDVKLIVENEAGCKDSITQQTRVYANPEADFSWDISCVTKPTFFYDETTLPEEDIDQEIVEWNWDFGVADIDWDASESQDPYYVYDTVMVHPVTLTVTDNHDCFSTLVQDIDTYVVPKANFSYEESDKMQGVVQFTDLSTGGEDLTWEYLDQLSIEQNPEITFEDDGTFPIHQIVKNEYQCADTMTVLYEMLFRTLFIPNAFSPNNPNTDVHEFKPIGRNLAEYRLQIYDLRGNLLFESTKLDENGVPEEGWDGKAMGIEMPAGIYMYHVTGIFEDGSIYNGTVIGDYKDSQMSNRGQLILIR